MRFIALVLFIGGVGLAGCTPSETDAQQKFSAYVSSTHGGAPIKVLSFQNLEAWEAGGFDGRQYFNMKIIARVEFLSAANHDCAPPNQYVGTCGDREVGKPIRYYANAGMVKSYTGTLEFQKNSAGWKLTSVPYFSL